LGAGRPPDPPLYLPSPAPAPDAIVTRPALPGLSDRLDRDGPGERIVRGSMHHDKRGEGPGDDGSSAGACSHACAVGCTGTDTGSD